MTEKFFTRGNANFTTRVLNEDETGYDSAPTNWQGLVETNLTITQEVTKFAADNNPTYAVVSSPPHGSGTVTLFGISNKDWQHILNVLTVDGKGTRFGEDLPIKLFSMSIDELASNGSKNKIIFYKVYINNLPSIITQTKAEDNVAKRDIVLDVETAPVFYNKTGGGKGTVIYDIINSVEDVKRWSENNETIMFPYDIREV